jgi:hypothetical protein
MMRKARGSARLELSDLSGALLRAFEFAIKNLHLVHELEYYFAGATDNENILCLQESAEGQAIAERARQHLWFLLVRTYVDDPTALIVALRGTSKWTLGRVVWGSPRIHRKDFSCLPFADWPKLAPTILAACDQAPEVMLPQLAALVTREAGHQHDDERLWTLYEFDPAQARMLFGDERDVLRRYRGEVQVLDEARDLMEVVKKAARALVDDEDRGEAE